MLDTLVDNAGASILYSHLGKVHSMDEPFTQDTRQAFELLAQYQKDNKILTTTTRRLLGYLRTVEELSFIVKTINDETHICVTTEFSGEDLQGLTWYVERPERVKLYINNDLCNDVTVNHDNFSGKSSITIQWRPLVFPATNTN
jgi:hypothetical protein